VYSQCCSVLQRVAVCGSVLQCVAVRCSALQCVAVRCSVLQCVAVCCSVLQCIAVCCSALQCVAVCCSLILSYRDLCRHTDTLCRHTVTDTLCRYTNMFSHAKHHIWTSHKPFAPILQTIISHPTHYSTISTHLRANTRELESMLHTATYCNKLTATHCNALQYTGTHL